MELAGGGAVCYAPSRLGKLVLRITGFPRVTHQCHQSQQQEDSHHRETRHLYLGFHHPWDRDLWKSWIKQVSQTQGSSLSLSLHYYLANFPRWPCSWIFLSYIFFFIIFLRHFFFSLRFLRLMEKKNWEEKIGTKIFSLKFYIYSQMNYGIRGTIQLLHHLLLLINNIRCAIF